MANHFINTPEALLGRNDSKNPATTCKGLTSSGRPCRRALALQSARGRSRDGVVAIVEDDSGVTEADFYCWQHKDQAEQRVQTEQNIPGTKSRIKHATELYPLKERSSIDTLVQKLGIEAIPESRSKKDKTRPYNAVRPPRRTSTQDFAQRPQSHAPCPEKYHNRPEAQHAARKKTPGFWSSLCCMTSQDDDYVEIVRHRRRTEQSPRPPERAKVSNSPSITSQRPSSSSLPLRPSCGRPGPTGRSSSNPQTGHLLSLIPQHLKPHTTSMLIAELVKPISPADEDGYIYIFWLTPQSRAAPAESTARSLLAAPSGCPANSRRISDVMTEFSYDGAEETDRGIPSGSKEKTIMLKIGRANNVTRRMNEWQRQCGYALNLVRWYPYIPSSGTPSPATSPRRTSISAYPDLSKPPTPRRDSGVVHKVPFVKRVERLIHLELAEQQIKKQCDTCGKEHREWFEVEATQEGVKNVDACVRRWVEWAEREAAR